MGEALLACQAATTGTAPASLAANASQQQAEQPAPRAQHAGQAAESQRGESEQLGEAAAAGAAAEAIPSAGAQPADVEEGGQPDALRRKLLPQVQQLAPSTEVAAAGDAAGRVGAATTGSGSGDGSASDSRESPSSGTGAGQGSSRAAQQVAAAGTTHYPAATTAAAVAGAGTTHYPVHFPPC